MTFEIIYDTSNIHFEILYKKIRAYKHFIYYHVFSTQTVFNFLYTFLSSPAFPALCLYINS